MDTNTADYMQLQTKYQWPHIWEFCWKEGLKTRRPYVPIDFYASNGLSNKNLAIQCQATVIQIPSSVQRIETGQFMLC